MERWLGRTRKHPPQSRDRSVTFADCHVCPRIFKTEEGSEAEPALSLSNGSNGSNGSSNPSAVLRACSSQRHSRRPRWRSRQLATAYLPWRAPRSFLCARVSRFQSGHARRTTNNLYKKLSQNKLIGEVKFLLPGETGAHLWARLRGMFSTAV